MRGWWPPIRPAGRTVVAWVVEVDLGAEGGGAAPPPPPAGPAARARAVVRHKEGRALGGAQRRGRRFEPQLGTGAREAQRTLDSGAALDQRIPPRATERLEEQSVGQLALSDGGLAAQRQRLDAAAPAHQRALRRVDGRVPAARRERHVAGPAARASEPGEEVLWLVQSGGEGHHLHGGRQARDGAQQKRSAGLLQLIVRGGRPEILKSVLSSGSLVEQRAQPHRRRR